MADDSTDAKTSPASLQASLGGSVAPLGESVAPLDALKFDHVAVAARSFDDVLPLMERLTGAKATAPERVDAQGVDVSFVGDLEVIVPFDPDTGVARFLDRRGPGLHHVAYRTDDVAALMEKLTAEGWTFTSAEPTVGRGGHRIAFLHPRSTGGLLVELVEKRRR